MRIVFDNTSRLGTLIILDILSEKEVKRQQLSWPKKHLAEKNITVDKQVKNLTREEMVGCLRLRDLDAKEIEVGIWRAS